MIEELKNAIFNGAILLFCTSLSTVIGLKIGELIKQVKTCGTIGFIFGFIIGLITTVAI